MAYLRPEDELQQQGGALSTGAGAAPPPGGASGGGAPAARGGPQGSGFTNLQQYLAVNQGAGQQMANTVAGASEAATGAARGAADNALGSFEKSVDAGTGRAPGRAVEGRNSRGDTEAPATAEQALAGQAGAAYQGPAAWGDAQKNAYAQQATNASTQSALLGSQAGLGVSLGQAYGKGGGYGQGARSFDSFLTGTAGQSRLQQAQSGYKDLKAYLGGVGDTAGKAIAGGQAASADAQGRWGAEASRLGQQEAAANNPEPGPTTNESRKDAINRRRYGDSTGPAGPGPNKNPGSIYAWIGGTPLYRP